MNDRKGKVSGIHFRINTALLRIWDGRKCRLANNSTQTKHGKIIALGTSNGEGRKALEVSEAQVEAQSSSSKIW